ncbi:hypothetical protein PN653_11495 [Parabacteroides distasonis]|jgi:hypothetical protein|uniref:hypothetical protein n=2 Tax=Parabacteroides distasonis TaxID=823 RepID=UPI00232E11D8|nr:hypothetical protein [Parabacteroides distasonis]MDB9001137.1 hypothetical protein [Parabacteroides distasonis]MDB9017311.1 hypothetical protein [Parabacteroides distasonis]MDB9055431.1 hypothetical protein [Parabacteroides distasonis]
MIEIKDISGKVKFSTPINVGAKGRFMLMKEDYITIPFSTDIPVDLKRGDYVDLRGVFDDALGGKLAKVYKYLTLQNPSVIPGKYSYELRFDAYYYEWNTKIFKFTPESHGQEAGWNLTAPLDIHLGLFLRNLKANGYTYNGVDYIFDIDSTVENKAFLMTYDNIHLLDALFSMASKDKWNCDCWITDNVIHFGRCEFGDAVDIELGVEAAAMTRSESKGTYATRVYVFGGTRNIPANYRPVDEQAVVNGVVQKRLMLPEGTPCIDAYPGMTDTEAVEDVVVFDDVFPKRIGTLSDVTTVDRDTETDGEVTGQFKAYQYQDPGLDFKEDYILEGEELKITFQSGKLNGMVFGVTFKPEGTDKGSQIWEIIANEDYGRLLPDEIMCPENGDEYVLSGFNIQLVSDQYIPEAEKELLAKGQEYVKKTSIDDGTYPTTLDSEWVYQDQINRTYDAGQRIRLINPAFFPSDGRISRVIGWEMNLDIPYDSPVYTIGESTQYSRIGELEDKVDTLTYKGQTYTGGGGSGVYIIRTNDSTPASDSNVFSALRSLTTFLRKDKPDVAGFDITFEQDIILSGEKSSIYSDRYAGGFGHENGFRLLADGTMWLKDLRVKNGSMFAGSLSSPTFASGFPNGTGFMIAPYKVTNAAGVEETKYKLEIDSISVRNELKVYTFVVSQLLGENDNRIFAGMMEVDHYDPETGRIYLDTDGGRLYNPFREGDILMVQQFQGDPTLQNDYKMTKSYELKVVEVAVGDLSDGENRLDWLRFTNFVGNLSDIAKRDTLCRVDNPDNSIRSGIMKITTVDEFGTPYMDVIRGMKTDPENCVKVRVGNMNGLVTPYFGRLEGDGIYVENLYARGQFMLDTGENVKTKFEIVEGRLSSEMSSVRYELSEKDNCLTNASFSADTVGWVLGNDVSLFTVKERFMAVNDSFYAEKDKVTGIVEVSSRKALYIKNSGVKQLNSYLKNKPDGQLEMPDGTKVWPTYYVSFMYMVKTAGTLTSGFSGQGLYVSKPLAITDTFVQEEFSGKWNGTGDFILNYTGEIYIYNVQMSTHPVEDLRLEMSTLFLQTDEKIGMYAQKIDTLNGTVTDMGAELDNTTSTLSLYVTKTDSINQTVTSLGLKLDGVDESLTLYAKKTDVSGLKTELEAAIKVNADNINLKVSKDSIISSINQTAETIKINASRLNLNGFVTFSMFDLSTQNTIKNKVNSGDLGSMAWKDGVSSDDLSWALSQEISNKVNLTTLNNTLLGYTKSGSITKEDLAKALQAELTGKLTGSASVGANKLASVIINGQTLIAGGYIQADLINVKDLVVGSTLSIGAFSLNSYKGLNWTGSDYFGNTSFRLTVGGGYTYNTGTSCKTMVGAWSNSADTHACISGICNTFGVAIYGSTDGWGSNFPPDGSKYAGFFSGSVFATGQMRCSGFSIYKSSDMYRYHYPGVSFNPADFDLDNVRLRVMGGIIVGVTDDNGNILLGS